MNLLKKVLEIWESPESEIERLARGKGHEVLFLPPYHPQLSPIELAWGRVKEYAAEIAPYDINRMMEEVLPEAFATIDEAYCKKNISSCA